MKAIRVLAGVGVLVGAGAIVASTASFRKPNLPGLTNDLGQTMLPSGWTVTPAGRHIPLAGDMPLAMTFLDDGAHLAVVSGGWHNQCVSLIDTESEKKLSDLDLGNAWAGIAADGDKLYVSGGSRPVRVLNVAGGSLTRGDDLKIVPNDGWTSGVLWIGNALYTADVNTGLIQRIEGDAKVQATVGGHPYGLAASPDGKTIAVSEWGASKVALLSAADLKPIGEIEVGSHPNQLVYGKDGRLFVACSGSDEVSVIRDGRVLENIRTKLDARDPNGSTTDALALSPNGKVLFAANADNNDVALIDITSSSESKVVGFIPTAWYPSALAVSKDGKKLFVGTGKGMRFYPNGMVGQDGKPAFKYIPSLLSGTLSVVDIPNPDELSHYTAQVISNTPRPSADQPLTRDDKASLAALKKIKHVLFIIRENRTYDQVFGDAGKGNSDPTLVMFGQAVTPNAHALASKYVLLDNTYCNGEVSEDGHQWCNGAYASDFVERAYINSYSGRGEPSDKDGMADSPNGYLWDSCRKHGKSYMSYGEYSSFKSTPDSRPVFTGTKGLDGHASYEWSNFQHGGDYGRDYKKVGVFLDDLKAGDKSGKWYDYMVMSLGEDHTSGLRPGSYTPDASVSSNDLGLGRIVEGISHSRFWKDTAVFVIEDDAQNGPDHVDAHRTAALVISPYVKRNQVDSTMYTTSSLVRTMEIILGLSPMTQYDERATPMLASFTAHPDFGAYDAITPTTDLEAKNPEQGALERASAQLDWSHYDAADPDKLNRILWRALKGNQKMPAPVRSAALAASGAGGQGDDD